MADSASPSSACCAGSGKNLSVSPSLPQNQYGGSLSSCRGPHQWPHPWATKKKQELFAQLDHHHLVVLQGEPLTYLNTAAHSFMSSLQIRRFNIAMRQARPSGTRPQAVTTIGWSFGMLGHGASWAPPSPRYPTSRGIPCSLYLAAKLPCFMASFAWVEDHEAEGRTSMATTESLPMSTGFPLFPFCRVTPNIS